MAIPYWAHGDIPDAAAMNEYSAALNALHTAVGDESINLPAPYLSNAFPGGIEQFKLIHQHRWLFFIGSGKIVDDAGIGEDVRLDAAGGGVVDLDAIDWMVYGLEYRVQGVDAAFEDPDPEGVI